MVAIKAHFDGRALIPEEPVELPCDRVLIVHVDTESGPPADESVLCPVLIPSNPEAARRLICDPESGLENF